jgi:CHAT domain-containing protein/tetratricopeptide (TPR) repeat protein
MMMRTWIIIARDLSILGQAVQLCCPHLGASSHGPGFYPYVGYTIASGSVLRRIVFVFEPQHARMFLATLARPSQQVSVYCLDGDPGMECALPIRLAELSILAAAGSVGTADTALPFATVSKVATGPLISSYSDAAYHFSSILPLNTAVDLDLLRIIIDTATGGVWVICIEKWLSFYRELRQVPGHMTLTSEHPMLCFLLDMFNLAQPMFSLICSLISTADCFSGSPTYALPAPLLRESTVFVPADLSSIDDYYRNLPNDPVFLLIGEWTGSSATWMNSASLRVRGPAGHASKDLSLNKVTRLLEEVALGLARARVAGEQRRRPILVCLIKGLQEEDADAFLQCIPRAHWSNIVLARDDAMPYSASWSWHKLLALSMTRVTPSTGAAILSLLIDRAPVSAASLAHLLHSAGAHVYAAATVDADAAGQSWALVRGEEEDKERGACADLLFRLCTGGTSETCIATLCELLTFAKETDKVGKICSTRRFDRVLRLISVMPPVHQRTMSHRIQNAECGFPEIRITLCCQLSSWQHQQQETQVRPMLAAVFDGDLVIRDDATQCFPIHVRTVGDSSGARMVKKAVANVFEMDNIIATRECFSIWTEPLDIPSTLFVPIEKLERRMASGVLVISLKEDGNDADEKGEEDASQTLVLDDDLVDTLVMILRFREEPAWSIKDFYIWLDQVAWSYGLTLCEPWSTALARLAKRVMGHEPDDMYGPTWRGLFTPEREAARQYLRGLGFDGPSITLIEAAVSNLIQWSIMDDVNYIEVKRELLSTTNRANNPQQTAQRLEALAHTLRQSEAKKKNFSFQTLYMNLLDAKDAYDGKYLATDITRRQDHIDWFQGTLHPKYEAQLLLRHQCPDLRCIYRIPEARAALSRVEVLLKQVPELALEYYYEKCSLLCLEKDYVRALEVAELAYARGKDTTLEPLILERIAECYLGMNRIPEAIFKVQQALKCAHLATSKGKNNKNIDHCVLSLYLLYARIHVSQRADKLALDMLTRAVPVTIDSAKTAQHMLQFMFVRCSINICPPKETRFRGPRIDEARLLTQFGILACNDAALRVSSCSPDAYREAWDAAIHYLNGAIEAMDLAVKDMPEDDPFKLMIREETVTCYKWLQIACVQKQDAPTALLHAEKSRARLLSKTMSTHLAEESLSSSSFLLPTTAPKLSDIQHTVEQCGKWVVVYSLLPMIDALYAWVIPPCAEKKIEFVCSGFRKMHNIMDMVNHGLRGRLGLSDELAHIDHYLPADADDAQKIDALLATLDLAGQKTALVETMGCSDYDALVAALRVLKSNPSDIVRLLVGQGVGTREAEHIAGVLSRDPMAELYDYLIRPLLPYLPAPSKRGCRDAEELVIIPCGALHAVPFAALIASEGEFLHSRTYLIDEYALSVCPSIRVLELCHARCSAREEMVVNEQEEYLVVGNPSFLSSYREFQFSPIPASLDEARDVVCMLDAPAKTVLLLQEDATKDNVLFHLNRARFVHIATHAFMNSSKPSWSIDGELALAPSASQKDSGMLSASDIASLRLKTIDLVFLSGCNTACGALYPGASSFPSEGFMGLARAFMLAGAPCVLSTLCRVNDLSTSKLVSIFYKVLKEECSSTTRRVSVASCLRLAIHALFHQQASTSSLPPLGWVEVVCVGYSSLPCRSLLPKNYK